MLKRVVNDHNKRKTFINFYRMFIFFSMYIYAYIDIGIVFLYY